ncbi:MAG: hypothetical protein M1838_003998 [Thelocarpon superellum]|nr:MAG: hypothetical protein M1838_003998 [Thelocarpon superellum]
MDPLDAMTNRRSRRGRCAFLPGPAESSPKRDTTVADEAREDDRLECACNMTYISRQCCFQPSGIVHEPAYLKLGEIRLKGDDEWWEVESMPETLARHLST